MIARNLNPQRTHGVPIGFKIKCSLVLHWWYVCKEWHLCWRSLMARDSWFHQFYKKLMRKLLVVTINDLYIFLSKSSIVLAAEDELSRMIYALSIQGGDSLIRQSLAFYTVCCLSPNNKLLLCVCVCVFYFSFFWGGGGGAVGGLWWFSRILTWFCIIF